MDNFYCSCMLLKLVLNDVSNANYDVIEVLAKHYTEAEARVRTCRTGEFCSAAGSTADGECCVCDATLSAICAANAAATEVSEGVNTRILRDKNLCPGKRSGTFCGALTAAIAVLYMEKSADEAVEAQDELMDWFADGFGEYSCEGIVASCNIPKEELCPRIILATYLKLRTYIDPDNYIPQKTII